MAPSAIRGELKELLAQPSVIETVSLRSERLGFMAFHGGRLEKTTDVVASEAAERSGASYYAIVQTQEPVTHISSKFVDPAESANLARFLEHVDAVVTIHGYGRQRLRWSVLLGGRNRTLAAHVARHLRPALADFEILDNLDEIPVELAGQHPDNPVNRTRQTGVQIELPPLLRWNIEQWAWSDVDGQVRAPQTEMLIRGLTEAATHWIDEPQQS